MKRIFALLLLAALAVIPRVMADSLPLTISPSKREINSRPGATATAPITLKNNSNKLITVNVSARDFTASDELNGEPKFSTEPNTKYGISNWFTDSNITRTLTIPGNQTITYDAKFRIPQNAVPRTYFGSVLFTSSDQSQNVSVAGLVFITVGQPATSLQISELTYGESDQATKHGVFSATITNTSEGLVTPVMRLKITDDSGDSISELEADTTGAVLPESARIFTFSLPTELPKTNLTATLSAVDQNGKTADKSIQLPYMVDPIEPPITGTPVERDQTAYLWLGLIPIIAILGAANRFMAHRKKQQTPPQESIDPPVPPTPPTNDI